MSGRFMPYLVTGALVVTAGFVPLGRLQPGTDHAVPALELGVVSAVPDILAWGVPAAIVLVLLMTLLPRPDPT